MDAYQNRNATNGNGGRSRQYDACMRRHVFGPVRPMRTPSLIERLFGLG